MKRNLQLLLLVFFLLFTMSGCASGSNPLSDDGIGKLKTEAVSYVEMLRLLKEHNGTTYDDVCGEILNGRTELRELEPDEIHNLAMIGYLELGIKPDRTDGSFLQQEPFPEEIATPTVTPEPIATSEPMPAPETTPPTSTEPAEGQGAMGGDPVVPDSGGADNTLLAFAGMPNEVKNQIQTMKASAKDYLRGQTKDYGPDNTCDSRMDTSWQVKTDEGKGQWLSFDFWDNKNIKGIYLWLGNWNEDKYYKDDRPTKLKLSFYQGDGEVGEPQEVSIDPENRTAYFYKLGTPVIASSVVIEIVEITTYSSEICISEVVFSGTDDIS